MARVQRGRRLGLGLLAALLAAFCSAPAAYAADPCLGCGSKPTVTPTGTSFTGTLVLPGAGGSATTVGGTSRGGGGSGAGCGDCYSQLVPACGNGSAVCLGANADQCISSGGLPMMVLFFDPPEPGGTPTAYLCLRPGQEPVSLDTVTQDVRRFVDELVPRDPQVVVQPEGGALVHVPTLVRAAMGTEPIVRQFFTGSGFAVTVTATPVRWDWSFGEGPVRSVAFPGAAYDGSDPATSGRHVTHTYATGGTRDVRVTVVWTASYVLPGVGTVEVGEVQRPSPVVQVPVRTARSQLVRS